MSRKSRENYKDKLIGPNAPFAITEAFKTLRTNLHYTAKNESCPVFAITSAYAHTGKSIIIANAALSYAHLKKKVLLIDADMRCPVINKIFDVKNERGLSDILASSDSDDRELSSYTVRSNTEGLDIITSGRIPPNPSELLSSPRLSELLCEAKDKYDYVFFDLPPVCEVSDAGIIASHVTAYLFAVRSGVTDSRAVSDALESLAQKGANIAGFVLNDVDLKTNGGHGRKYYYKYGKYSYLRNYSDAISKQNDGE